jgi:hypothetical protein
MLNDEIGNSTKEMTENIKKVVKNSFYLYLGKLNLTGNDFR